MARRGRETPVAPPPPQILRLVLLLLSLSLLLLLLLCLFHASLRRDAASHYPLNDVVVAAVAVDVTGVINKISIIMFQHCHYHDKYNYYHYSQHYQRHA